MPPQKLQMQWFTDSDHNLQFQGAKEFQYKQLTQMLYEERQKTNKKQEEEGGCHVPGFSIFPVPYPTCWLN